MATKSIKEVKESKETKEKEVLKKVEPTPSPQQMKESKEKIEIKEDEEIDADANKENEEDADNEEEEVEYKLTKWDDDKLKSFLKDFTTVVGQTIEQLFAEWDEIRDVNLVEFIKDLSNKTDTSLESNVNLFNSLKCEPKVVEEENKTPKTTCIALVSSGKRAGKVCGRTTSKSSVTNKYCISHVPHEREDYKPKSINGNLNSAKCQAVNKTGEKRNQKCGRRCAKDSNEFCCIHFKAMKLGKDPNQLKTVVDKVKCEALLASGDNKGKRCEKWSRAGSKFCGVHMKV